MASEESSDSKDDEILITKEDAKDSTDGNDSLSESAMSDYQDKSSFNIIGQKFNRINTTFVLDMSKNSSNNKSRRLKKSCKILTYKCEGDFSEVLETINSLKPEEYPNLFIFVIELKRVGFYKAKDPEDPSKLKRNKKCKKVVKLKECLLNFSKTRPLVIQLESKCENVTRFYYKDYDSNKFLNIDTNQKFYKFVNFSNVWCSYNKEGCQEILEKIVENYPKVQNRSLILRLVRTFEISENYFIKLIYNCAAFGSINDLFAILDNSFEDNARLVTEFATFCLSNIIIPNEDSSESVIESDQESTENETSSTSSDDHLNTSILLTAINHKNKQIVEYLISHCTHLIQQLPLKHQIIISTKAFRSNQIEVLCDLIDISDFPFPQNCQIDSTKDERFQAIVAERTKLFESIPNKNIDKITEFVQKNLNLKIVYNTKNKSLLEYALDLRKFKIYYYLKTQGFQATEFVDLKKVLNNEEMKEATKHRVRQKKKNIDDALRNHEEFVNTLCNKSFILNRQMSKQDETNNHQKIRKWFGDISRIQFGYELLKVAASCDELKIIFDFESFTVENVILTESNAAGSMNPTSKWIFIGAKLSDKNREQQIKGVLAHELCHYVIKLVYENNEKPYYKHCADIIKIFEGVVQAIDKWSAEDSDDPDDECGGIISSVFQLYNVSDFHPELIVRVVQILAEFDDKEEMSIHLQDKYKELFDYFRVHVLTEMQKFCMIDRKNLRSLNENFKLLSELSNHKFELAESKVVESLIEDDFAILLTNIPKLLLLDIYIYYLEEYGNLISALNIFVDLAKLNNPETLKDLNETLSNSSDLNIFLYCSKEDYKVLPKIVINKMLKYFFITSDEDFPQFLTKRNIDLVIVILNYEWKDFSERSKKNILDTKIIYQDKSEYTFLDILKDDASQSSSKIIDFETIIDENLLNLLSENQQISINVNNENENFVKNFKLLFQERTFTLKNTNRTKITIDEIIAENNESKYILISDIAGTGKSWVMKRFAYLVRKVNPTRWLTYVDLKQHIREFKLHDEEVEFSSFIAENILKTQNDFEKKIFKKFYENGKIVIFFDGFDEIAPDCAKCVSDLFKLFEQNGGNQLWIATRDYFEVELNQILKIDNIYKLDEFSNEDAVNFIAKSWVLKDSNIDVVKSKDEFDEILKNSKNYKNYQKISREIIEKVKVSDSQSVGMVQLFRMIADGFKDDKEILTDIKEFTIFEKFAERLYERWSTAKGEIRKTANTKSLRNELNFWKFHQYSAMIRLFPEHAKILFRNYKHNEWSDEEIIACALMSKQGGLFYFLHETFCEFFIADYVAKFIKNIDYSGESSRKIGIFDKLFRKRSQEKCCFDLFVTILKTKKYEIVRIFLNDGIGNSSALDKILKHANSLRVDILEKFECFDSYFTCNLDNLVDFIITILKNSNYKKTKKIVSKSSKEIFQNTRCNKIFKKFQDFLFEFLNEDDIKEIISKDDAFLEIISSPLEVDVFEEFKSICQKKLSLRFVLNLTSNKNLRFICDSPNVTSKKIQIWLENHIFINKTLREELSIVDSNGRNFLLIYSQSPNVQKFKLIWIGIENFLDSIRESHTFIQMASHKDDDGKTILHYSVTRNDFEFHEVLWQLLLKTFYDREDLENLIFDDDNDGNKFLHELIKSDLKQEILYLIFKTIKLNFINYQIYDIFDAMNKSEQNLLQYVTQNFESLELYTIIWELHKNNASSDEIRLCVLYSDKFENNILSIAVKHNSIEIVDFILQEISMLLKKDKYIELFSNDLLKLSLKNHKHPEVLKRILNKRNVYEKRNEIDSVFELLSSFEHYSSNDLSITEKLSTESNSKISYKENFLMKKDLYGNSILNYFDNCKSVEDYDIMWDILLHFFPK